MKTNRKIFLITICIICISLVLTSCNRREKYEFDLYSKNEVRALYRENTELFKSIVSIISANEVFYEKSQTNEFDNPDITSPYDKDLTYFSDTDKKIIQDFFELCKPYMILYDYGKRFVEITFISDTFMVDNSVESYTFLFWVREDDSNGFVNYKSYIEQNYITEYVAKNCFLLYKKTK